jgi:DNA-binding SARP family transcriptional activator/tetratricopeptide (TPR) repeat protein
VDGVEFRVLGPVGVWCDGDQRHPSNAQQRTVLARLLLSPGTVVSLDELVTALWGEDPPATARNALHGHVSRVRRMLNDLPEAALHTVGQGYRLDVPRRRVDLHRFRELASSTRRPELAAALDLWRGPAFADVAGDWLAATAGQALDQERLTAIDALARAELEDDRGTDAVVRLQALVAAYPLREDSAGLLMTALHRTGRRRDALDVYRQTRQLLTEQLGIEPGARLQRIHREVLAGTGDGDGDSPRQLPADVPDFTGRTAELAALDALPGGSARVAVIGGPAGMGKTSLAVHWAHRVADKFPDGQLFVNLRGFDATGAATATTDALAALLTAVGVPQRRLPAGEDALAALFRTTMADRRLLILLDNARDAAQVRPLLPGAPGCFVLITSRNRLSGLVAGVGAVPLTLDRPSAGDARDFLTRRLGSRVANEPGAEREIVESCGRLPLALAVVAARAATTQLPLAALAADLRECRSRLDALSDGDPATDVRTVFSWSYHALGPQAARLFRLLGMHVGPDVSLSTAAALAGVPAGRVRQLAGELTRVHLVEEHVPGRYAFHDLLRTYAGELADAEPEAERRAGLRRLLDHLLHSARLADAQVEPNRTPIRFETCDPGVHPDRPADAAAALSWFDTERAALVEAVDRAAAEGFPAHAWQLAWAIKPWLSRQWHRRDQIRTQRSAVAAAERSGDQAAQAAAYRYLADGHDRLGEHDEAETCHRRAADLYHALGDVAGQAHMLYDLASMFDRRGRHADAAPHLEAALPLFRQAGDFAGEARCLGALGWERAQLGDYGPALEACHAAVALLRERGDRHAEGASWDSIGFIHHRRGDLRQARECYERGLAIALECGDRHAAAETLVHLGESQLAAGEPDACRAAWTRALALLDDRDTAAASALRNRLHGLS